MHYYPSVDACAADINPFRKKESYLWYFLTRMNRNKKSIGEIVELLQLAIML
jgi:hypothetical protein